MDRRAGRASVLDLAPALLAACYPLLLDAFHAVVGASSGAPDSSAVVLKAVLLSGTLVVPAAGIAFAMRRHATVNARRLAYACVVAPTLYVLLGVLQAMSGSTVADEIAWAVLWFFGGFALLSRPGVSRHGLSPAGGGQWRVVHGIAGAVLLVYVSFHIANHLYGLVGPEMHAKVMEMGRMVYRSPSVEPLLVILMIGQVVSGFHLALRRSRLRLDLRDTFQTASGFYLSIFILGHMNSVFLYARTYLGVPTGWAFATGAPAGLLQDPWNIRLVPHYLLGVFFVLAHLGSGMRSVLIGHGVDRTTADRVWNICLAVSAVVAGAVIAGMCGGRLAAF